MARFLSQESRNNRIIDRKADAKETEGVEEEESLEFLP
eukprot:CAMPEP_0171532272 /NCGR_PEP_ID=MMETSP0959-20130129/14693_1 /TAXON_ID=87120 /ORGANISM="Aurantiochytrium limacinum, Strain ATCCMYA-1381" /LENGTH=37 /DNA_ID= /DNA_START= /DNA_END= /DNA_ORIENTATION=